MDVLTTSSDDPNTMTPPARPRSTTHAMTTVTSVPVLKLHASHRAGSTHATTSPTSATTAGASNGNGATGGGSGDWVKAYTSVSSFRLRAFASGVLFVWLLVDIASDAELQSGSIASHARDRYQAVLPIYRGVGCMILLWWCYGVNLWVWARYRIAYLHLFELDARTHMPYPVVFDHSVTATLIYEINLLWYRKIVRGEWSAPFIAAAAGGASSAGGGGGVTSGLPATVYPVLLFLAFVATVIYHLHASAWLKAMRAVVCAPFSEVTFIAAYVGDIFTSLIKVFIDLAYAVCYTAGLTWLSTHDSAGGSGSAPATAVAAGGGFGPAGTAAFPAGADGRSGSATSCAESYFFKMWVVTLLTALPLWWRLMQCLRRYMETNQRFPHLANAAKYALSHSVLLFGVLNPSLKAPLPIQSFLDTGSDAADAAEAAAVTAAALAAEGGSAAVIVSPFQVIWLLFMVASTLYTFSWDVTMDWDLGHTDTTHTAYRGLRDHLLFRRPAMYWAAIAIDLVLRFAWSLTLIPRGSDSPLPEALTLYLDPALAGVEIMRRCMWGCLRLENEHLRNKLDGHNSAAAIAGDALVDGASSPLTATGADSPLSEPLIGSHKSGDGSGLDPNQLIGTPAGTVPSRGWQVVFEVTVMAMTVLGIGGLAAVTSRPPST